MLAHSLALLRPLITGALGPLSKVDGTLLLLGALALVVLVLASSSLLRLLARLGDEGWEGWGR